MLHSISLTELVTRLSGSSTVKTDVKPENASESESENQDIENMDGGEEGSEQPFSTDIKVRPRHSNPPRKGR
eukprot:119924-Pyramimonas_sp.AAC.1